MKKAVMYGGGNIGRGFIGKVFSDSGYEVCFLDIMQPLIDEMNRKVQKLKDDAQLVREKIKAIDAENKEQ